MSVITRNALVAKNKAGNGIINNDNGSNRQNNQAAKKLVDILRKAEAQIGVDDVLLADSIKIYSDALNTLATTRINQNTHGRINLALGNLNGFGSFLSQKDPYLGKTNYELIVDTLGPIGSSKEEFDQALLSANTVLELGMEKTVLAHMDPAEMERRRQEQERQRQEQERLRQEQERQRQEQLRAANAENLSAVVTFKAQNPTKFSAALLAQKNGAQSSSKPLDFINHLKTEAQERLSRMNLYPEAEHNGDQRRLVVDVLKNIENINQSLKDAPGPNASADEKRKFIEQTQGTVRSLQTAYNLYHSNFMDEPVFPLKPAEWPDEASVAADAKPSLDALYDEKDMNFAKKFSDAQLAVDKGKADELKKLLNEQEPEAETAKFSAVEVPGKEKPTISEAYESFIGIGAYDNEADKDEFDTVQMAVDEKGNAFSSREEIIREISKPGQRLYVFHSDGELPFALENRNGVLFASAEGISSKYQIPGKDGLFEPKKSLDPKDMAQIPSHKAIEKLMSAKKEHMTKVKHAQHWIDEGRTKKREAEEWLAAHKNAPRLGAARTFQRWMYKAITLGFGETNAYKKYRARKERWVKNVKAKPAIVDAINRRIPAMKAAHAESKAKLNEIDEKLRPLQEAYYSKQPEAQKKKIQEYRKNTAVRMEGVADIIKKGKITQENIFANTWLAEQACRGKKLGEGDIYSNLISYVASRSIEEAVLKETIKDPEYSEARNSIMVESLNNGSAAETLRKSGIFNKILQEQGDKPIDPEEIYKTYTERVKERDLRQSDKVFRLKTTRRRIIREFGEKPISKDCLRDIAKLNAVDKMIKEGEELNRRLADLDEKEQKYGLTPMDKQTRAQLRVNHNQFKENAENLNTDLNAKDGKRPRTQYINMFMKPEYKKALDAVEQNMNAAKGNIDKAFADLPEHQKKAWLNSTETFSLETMADMVNKTVEMNRQAEKQIQQPQAGGPQA